MDGNFILITVLIATLLGVAAVVFAGPSPDKARKRRVAMIRGRHSESAEALLEARRSCGLAGGPSDIPSLREMLYARALEISASAGGKRVEFLVSVEEGKPKVKAVLR